MGKLMDKILWRGGHACPWWLCFSFDNPIRAAFQKPDKIVKKYISLGDDILDIGPGQGYFTFPMARLTGSHGKVVALDIQRKMLEIIKRRAEKRNVKNVETVAYDGQSFGIAQKFDFVNIFWMMHEVEEKENFVAEIKKVCKTDTRLLLAEPPVHVTKKTFEAEVAMFQGAGFTVIEKLELKFSRAVVMRLKEGKEEKLPRSHGAGKKEKNLNRSSTELARIAGARSTSSQVLDKKSAKKKEKNLTTAATAKEKSRKIKAGKKTEEIKSTKRESRKEAQDAQEKRIIKEKKERKTKTTAPVAIKTSGKKQKAVAGKAVKAKKK